MLRGSSFVSKALGTGMLATAAVFVSAAAFTAGCNSRSAPGSSGAGTAGSAGTAGNAGTSGSAAGGPALSTPGRNAREVVISADHHPLGQPLTAVVETPSGDGPFPGCVIVHGSGGLFRERAYGDPCSDEVERNFSELQRMLVADGVAALLPSSFYSRDARFCEDNSDYIDFAPSNYDREERRIALRTYDLLAASDYFCRRDDVDCSRLCFIGTSNGGSIIVHYLHEHLSSSFARFFEDDAVELDPVPYVPMPAARPMPQFAVAVSPGCGLRGAIGLESDPDDLPSEPIESLYHPAVPLFLEIGDRDSVPDECTTRVPGFDGTRELQVAEVERRRGTPPGSSRYRVTIRAGGEHDLLGGEHGDAIRADFMDRVLDRL